MPAVTATFPSKPVMDPRERLLLESFLRKDMTMLEYGSGGSTTHFSK